MKDRTDDDDAFGKFGVVAWVIQRNRREQLRIGLNEFRGNEYIDVRLFYLADDGSFKPSRKGITLPTRCYQDLLRGILELGALIGEIDQETLTELTSRSG